MADADDVAGFAIISKKALTEGLLRQ